MVPTILLIQFRTKERAAELEYQSVTRGVGENIMVQTVSALDDSVAWHDPALVLKNVQGVILGGSGDFDFDGGRTDYDEARVMSGVLLERLRPVLEYIFKFDFPTFGICFGHQLLGTFAGANVVHDSAQSKTKSHTVEIIPEASAMALLRGVPQAFDAYYIHKDALDRLPDGAELLGHGGEECKFSVLRYQKNIFSTQFHPELTYDDVLVRIDTFPGYLPEGVDADRLFSRDVRSNTILFNFGALLQAQQ